MSLVEVRVPRAVLPARTATLARGKWREKALPDQSLPSKSSEVRTARGATR